MAYHMSQGNHYFHHHEEQSRQMFHFGHQSPASIMSMDEIDPALMDINFPEYTYTNSVFPHSFPAEQRPLQRYITEPDSRPSFLNSLQRERNFSPIAPLPHVSRRDSPTPSMHSHGITMTSSNVASPAGESDLAFEPAIFPHSLSYSSSPSQYQDSGSQFLTDLSLSSSSDSSIPRYSSTFNGFEGVKMSEIQSFQDVACTIDEGYGTFMSSANSEYIQLSQPGLRSMDQHEFCYPLDEGLGTSIPDEDPSQTIVVAVPIVETIEDEDADADDYISPVASPASDTSYNPNKSSRLTRKSTNNKRSRDAYDTSSSGRSGPKRARTTKDSNTNARSVSSSMTNNSSSSVAIANSPNNKHHKCTHCTETHSSAALLSKHIAKEHTKSFECVFAFAGCGSVFASKNEWKRHVYSQHCNFCTWTCNLEDCGKPNTNGSKNWKSRSNSQSGSASQNGRGNGMGNGNAMQMPAGVHFNRKDLYTQHLRRMHKSSKLSPTDWEARIKDLQEKNCHITRPAPLELRCPVRGCNHSWRGKNTWDERMEHVGKHLEVVGSSKGGVQGDRGERVDQGADELLVRWAIEQGIVEQRGEQGRCRYTLIQGEGARRKGIHNRPAARRNESDEVEAEVESVSEDGDDVDEDAEGEDE